MAVQEVAPPVADVRGVEHAVPAVDHVVIDREDHRGGIGGYASGPVSMRLVDRTRRSERQWPNQQTGRLTSRDSSKQSEHSA